MSLLEMKEHLMQVRVATLGSIAQHFHSDPELIRNMMGHWVRKGCVRQFSKTPSCGEQCVQCSGVEHEIYEWIYEGLPRRMDCFVAKGAPRNDSSSQ